MADKAKMTHGRKSLPVRILFNSKQEQSEVENYSAHRAANLLLKRIVDEIGGSQFSKDDLIDVLGEHTIKKSASYDESPVAATSRMKKSFLSLIKRELIEEVDYDKYEVTIKGHMLAESLDE